MRLGPVLVAASMALGCASFDTGSVARASAAELLACNEAAVEVEQIGAYRYRAEGCGDRVTMACTAGALEPQCLRVADGAPVAADMEDHAPGEPPGPVESEAEPAPDDELEARIRANLDARSDDILACVGAERAAVRAAYAADGAITFSLQGPLAGGPEERCVRDALEGARAPASGRGGVVIHLVR